jgi:hypothetical protein
MWRPLESLWNIVVFLLFIVGTMGAVLYSGRLQNHLVVDSKNQFVLFRVNPTVSDFFRKLANGPWRTSL